jgi:hypothetical protein
MTDHSSVMSVALKNVRRHGDARRRQNETGDRVVAT